MARTSVFDLQAVGDPALSWNFDLFLPSIPGSADTRDLTWKCMSTGLPGSEINRVPVPMHGVELIYMGNRQWSHTFNTTFLEAIDWQTRTKLFNWMEAGRSWAKNSGSEAATYKVTGQITLYDDIPNVAKTITVYGMWPSNIADITLDGGNGTGHVTQDITWSFDFSDS
jgi:hypothetical protein